MGHRVTRYSDSNYVPFERRKNGSLTFCSRNWLGNIFPISRDQSSQNQILGRKYISGKQFTSVNCIGNVLKSEFRSPFRRKLLTGKEFLDAGRNFSKVNISSLNLNTNFEFLWQKSRELLSFEYIPPRNLKFGFQLCVDRGV